VHNPTATANIAQNGLPETKTRLLNLSPAELSGLQKVKEFREMSIWLGTNGWLNVFLGGLTLWLGLQGASHSILKALQALLGVLLIAQSLWSIIRPSTRAVLGFSLLFLITGIWNVFISVLAGLEGITWLVASLGLLQLWWAYKVYLKYQSYQKRSITVPSPETTSLYDEIWRAIAKVKPQSEGDPAFIKLLISTKMWNGLLVGDLAVFARSNTKLLMWAPKADVRFDPLSPTIASGPRVGGTIKIGDTTSESVGMPQVFYQKYVQWKSV
jgi:hypothetical protein